MKASAYPKSSQGGLTLPGLLIFALMFIPQDLTWTLTNFENGPALRLATAVHPLDAWFPQLTFDLCVLANYSWEDTEQTPENFYPVCKYSE